MNAWIIGKNLMKYQYQKKKIFTLPKHEKILLMQITRMQKEFVKILR